MIVDTKIGTRVFHVTAGKTRRDPSTGEYYWFFALPRLRWNGGWRRTQTIDVSINWLIFWISFTLWPCGSARA